MGHKIALHYLIFAPFSGPLLAWWKTSLVVGRHTYLARVKNNLKNQFLVLKNPLSSPKKKFDKFPTKKPNFLSSTNSYASSFFHQE
jgi:hypothetical protein